MPTVSPAAAGSAPTVRSPAKATSVVTRRATKRRPRAVIGGTYTDPGPVWMALVAGPLSSLGAAGQESAPVGKHHRLGSVMGLDLREHAFHVGLGGRLRDDEQV